MDNRVITIKPPRKRTFSSAGYLLGFSLGGFFDGILLHQVLQWHHVFSAVERPPFDDIRVQIMADGVFHAAMYAIALAGLWGLFRARHIFSEKAADRLLVANALIGFGIWHVVDAVLLHWILEIHHIRMAAKNPLLWDILWFAVFGLLFIAAGILLRRRAEPPSFGDSTRSGPRSTMTSLLVAAVASAATFSAFPPANGPLAATTTVVLRPGASPARLLASLQQLDARIIWSSAKGEVWVFALDRNADRFKFYQHGAMFVSGAGFPAGCAAWTRLQSV